MTTSPISQDKRNRLVVPALVLVLLGMLIELLLSVVNAIGLPHRLMGHGGGGASFIMTWYLCTNVVSLLTFAAMIAGLLMAVVAVTQMRCGACSLRGKGLAYLAVAIALGGFVLVRLMWIGRSVFALLHIP